MVQTVWGTSADASPVVWHKKCMDGCGEVERDYVASFRLICLFITLWTLVGVNVKIIPQRFSATSKRLKKYEIPSWRMLSGLFEVFYLTAPLPCVLSSLLRISFFSREAHSGRVAVHSFQANFQHCPHSGSSLRNCRLPSSSESKQKTVLSWAALCLLRR